jgi:hypothetical protein
MQHIRTHRPALSSLVAAAIVATAPNAAVLADGLPPWPHGDAPEIEFVDLVATRDDTVATMVDAARLLGLGIGDRMPADLAGDAGPGQRLVRSRPAADGGRFLFFVDPFSPARSSEVLVRDGRVAAVVRDGRGSAASVRTLDDGRMVRQRIEGIDEAECGGCGSDGGPKPGSKPGPLSGGGAADGGEGGVAGSCDDGNVVDVFILVHVDAAIEMGGLTATLEQVALCMEAANNAYDNSGITLHARLVGVRLVGDALFDGDDFSTDLDRLRNSTDGFFDIGTDSRAEWGADMIKLLRPDDLTDGPGGLVGLGFLLLSSDVLPSANGFSVDVWTYSVPNHTFTHELGHNMGCCHAPGDGGGCNAGDGYYTYSFGNRFTGTGGSNFRTVMAYNPGTRIAYFSSPLVDFDGVATGSATRDNARSIRNTRTVFCDYVCSTVPDNDECTAATTIADGGSLVVTNDHATNYGSSGLAIAGSDYNDVWATFTPPSTGQALLRLCATSATTETTLGVWALDCSGEPLASDAGTYGFEFCASEYSSALTVQVVAGVRYLVRCSCAGNAVFTGTLSYDFTPLLDCGFGTGPCYEVHAAAGCTYGPCCATVCGVDPFCCDKEWDQICVDQANDFCAQCGDTASSCYGEHAGTGCADESCCALVTAADGGCGNVSWDADCVRLALELCAGCGSPDAGGCWTAHAGTGCSDGDCCLAVCGVDPYCCDTEWDQICVDQATTICGILGDLSGDGRVDAQDLSLLLGAWGTAGGDLTGDGTTDGADMSVLLGAWTG